MTSETGTNFITFEDGADAPLVKCTTAIQGNQDLHGYSKPWVGGAGKNKIPVLLSEVKSNNTSGTWSGDTYSYSGVTFNVESNSEGYVTKITVNASPSSSAFSFYLKRATTSFTSDTILNGCPSGGGDSTYDLRVSGGYRDYGVGATIPANASFSDFWIVIRSGITVSNLVFEPIIRLATVTDPTFAPYSNICPITAYTEGEIEVSDGDGNVTTHTTTYPSAIYRGSEDVVNGSETHDMPCVDLGDFAWSYNSTAKTFFTPLGTIVKRYTASEIANALSEKFGVMSNSDITNDLTLDGVFSIHYAAQQSWLNVRWLDYTVASDFKTAVTGTKLAYELATPTTSTVTPTNLPIKSLLGYNHIESSTGEMEIEYFPAKEQPIIDLIPEASNMHTYSTAEHAVGTWIDGETIYEKTLQFTSTSTADTMTSVAHSIANVDVIYVEKAFVVGSTYTQEMAPVGGLTGNDWFQGAVNSTSFDYQVGNDFVSCQVYVVLRYTKSV